MVGLFEKYENFSYVILGWETYVYSCFVYLYCAQLTLSVCVCGDDRITCYPGADDVTGGPGDAQTRSEGQQGIFLYIYIYVYYFSFENIM